MEPSNDDNILEVVAVLGATQMVSKFLVCYASQYVSVHSNSTQKELSPSQNMIVLFHFIPGFF